MCYKVPSDRQTLLRHPHRENDMIARTRLHRSELHPRRQGQASPHLRAPQTDASGRLLARNEPRPAYDPRPLRPLAKVPPVSVSEHASTREWVQRITTVARSRHNPQNGSTSCGQNSSTTRMPVDSIIARGVYARQPHYCALRAAQLASSSSEHASKRPK